MDTYRTMARLKLKNGFSKILEIEFQFEQRNGFPLRLLELTHDGLTFKRTSTDDPGELSEIVNYEQAGD